MGVGGGGGVGGRGQKYLINEFRSLVYKSITHNDPVIT